MTARIEKTVFISYRRTNLPWALFVYQNLTMHGYDVFFDYQSIDSGNFEGVILDNIRARAHFIVILTPSALENCKKPGDWLRREIETAMDENRNIVPLMVENFDFGSVVVKDALTGKLSKLNTYNGLQVPNAYALEAMERLRERYLNKALSDIPTQVLRGKAQTITETQQLAASEAAPVQEEELTAQTWFERGYVFSNNNNFDEAIRCFTEAIRLQPDFTEAYFSRGDMLRNKSDWAGAIADYNEAITLKPSFASAFNNRGLIRRNIGDYERAIADFNEAIKLEPDLAGGYYYNRGIAYQASKENLLALADFQKASELMPKYGSVQASLSKILKLLGRNQEAEEHEKIARELIQKESEYDQACFEAIFGNTERALSLLKLGLKKKPYDKAWASQDPDLASLRDDPRFRELVSE